MGQKCPESPESLLEGKLSETFFLLASHQSLCFSQAIEITRNEKDIETKRE